MASSLHIDEASLPSLDGKVALVTGGSSGLGYGAVKILAERGAKVVVLDLHAPAELDSAADGRSNSNGIEFVRCDVTVWAQLRRCFLEVGRVDMVFANAGVLENTPFLQLGEDGLPPEEEPDNRILDINLRAVINTVRLACSVMRRQDHGGSIVLTSSQAAYCPNPFIPIYSVAKLALIGLVRSLRHILPRHNITINAVAPASTDTPMIPPKLQAMLRGASFPINSPRAVGLALVYSATADESRRVDAFGKDDDADAIRKAPWNGRVILVMGDQYSELEEPYADSRPTWFGHENLQLARAQDALTDTRDRKR